MILTALQKKVVEVAVERLSGEWWYSGVSVDDIPSDFEIEADFEGAVTQVMLETAYWDQPNFLRDDN